MKTTPRSRASAAAPARERAALNRGAIVDAALALIDRDGLETLSMRRLGAALGVEAMAIYHHYAGKGELLDAVVERLLAEVRTDAPDADPLDRLRRCVASYRDVAVRHPKAFGLLTNRRFNTPAAFEFYERVLQMLADAGFDARASARMFRLIGYYINGAGLAEIASRAQQPDATPVALEGAGEPGRPAAIDRFPRVAAVAPHLRIERLDEVFGYGLDVIFDHLRAAAPRPKPRRR
ncbi:MAG: TetR/AcrR family transcriptional regulator C-terminal domain-containing protein [Burkholderiaceae bacterium]